MAIEKKIVRIHPDRDKYAEKFIDLETKEEFRRILCGYAWPYLKKPGFVLVLAEDWEEDHSIPHSPRHVRVQEGIESSDIEELHRICKKFKSEYLFKSILGDHEHALNKIWLKYGELKITPPHLFEPVTLDVVTALVTKNTTNRKTLHFGDESVLRRYLDIFPPEDIENQQLEQNPPLAALGYCLAEMELNEPIYTRPPGSGPRIAPNHQW